MQMKGKYVPAMKDTGLVLLFVEEFKWVRDISKARRRTLRGYKVLLVNVGFYFVYGFCLCCMYLVFGNILVVVLQEVTAFKFEKIALERKRVFERIGTSYERRMSGHTVKSYA